MDCQGLEYKIDAIFNADENDEIETDGGIRAFSLLDAPQTIFF